MQMLNIVTLYGQPKNYPNLECYAKSIFSNCNK